MGLTHEELEGSLALGPWEVGAVGSVGALGPFALQELLRASSAYALEGDQ